MKFDSRYSVEIVFDGSKLGIEPYVVLAFFKLRVQQCLAFHLELLNEAEVAAHHTYGLADIQINELNARESLRIGWQGQGGVHTWSVDANQLIADEEDATYSCRISSVLLLEEVVNSFDGEGILAITDGAKQWFTESQIRKVAEETCYNPCMCKCNSGSLIGSSKEIFSNENEVGLALSLEVASSHDESPTITMLADADGGEQNKSGGEQQLSAGLEGKGGSYQGVWAIRVVAEKVTNAMAFEDKNENKKNGNNGEERGPHLTHNFELKEMETCDYLEEEEANNSLSGPIKNNSVERQGGEHKLLGLKVNRPDPIWKHVNFWQIREATLFALSSLSEELLETEKNKRDKGERKTKNKGIWVARKMWVSGKYRSSENAPDDVVKAIYDVSFNAVINIILQSDDHSEIQNGLSSKSIAATIVVERPPSVTGTSVTERFHVTARATVIAAEQGGFKRNFLCHYFEAMKILKIPSLNEDK
ncbi:hypothetical protein JHK86_010288 [Glycine max]|nr:hypothetical protein JHK86_010288 [Glycine max]